MVQEQPVVTLKKHTAPHVEEQKALKTSDSFITLHLKYEKLLKCREYVLSIIRLVNEEVRKYIFELLVHPIAVSNFKIKKEWKNAIKFLLKIRIAEIRDQDVYLRDEFRTTVLLGFKDLGSDIEYVPEDTADNSTMEDSAANDSQCASPAMKAEHSTSVLFKAQPIKSEDKNFMIRSCIVNPTSEKPRNIIDIIIYANLITPEGEITDKGFEFLLISRNKQIWLLLMYGLSYYSTGGTDEYKSVCKISEICLKNRIGKYRCASWGKIEELLESVGIIRECSKGVFYIDNSGLFESASDEMCSRKYIILETNLKVYAYTNQKYEKCILNLFTNTESVLPNLVRAEFSEESLCNALRKGITAHLILKYLEEYSVKVPINIANQIRIWEDKQNRIKMQRGVICGDIMHLSDYLEICRFLERKEWVLYQDRAKRIVVGKIECYDELVAFIDGLS